MSQLIILTIYAVWASIIVRLPQKYRLRLALQSRAVVEQSVSSCRLFHLQKQIHRIGRLLPWRFMCYESAITARLYLRRRGVISELCLGARTSGDQQIFHAWLCSDDLEIIGYPDINSYHKLRGYKDYLCLEQ